MNAKLWKESTSIIAILVSLLMVGCRDQETSTKTVGQKTSKIESLPYLGEHDIQFLHKSDSSIIADTIYYTLPKFSFINQDNKEISHRNYSGKIFITEFFFTECPSICPIMSSQMARLQELIKKEGLNQEVMLLSLSVKPDHDTPEILRAYGDKLGADYSNWNFFTGDALDIYDLAENGFMLSAFPDEKAEGGVFHTDKLTLIDSEMHIRGYYDGTSTKSVDQLFQDLLILQQQEQTK
jgi:protein SCO1/2